MRFQLPADGTDWAILALHCALTLGAQLSLAAGYATTRAGIGGFLQLTELAWVYAIDVTILAEPTSLFASFGTILVFASALLVLQVGSSTSGKAGQTSAAPATKEMGPSSSLRESLLPPGAQSYRKSRKPPALGRRNLLMRQLKRLDAPINQICLQYCN